jgi:hypothetical protein
MQTRAVQQSSIPANKTGLRDHRLELFVRMGGLRGNELRRAFHPHQLRGIFKRSIAIGPGELLSAAEQETMRSAPRRVPERRRSGEFIFEVELGPPARVREPVAQATRMREPQCLVLPSGRSVNGIVCIIFPFLSLTCIVQADHGCPSIEVRLNINSRTTCKAWMKAELPLVSTVPSGSGRRTRLTTSK